MSKHETPIIRLDEHRLYKMAAGGTSVPVDAPRLTFEGPVRPLRVWSVSLADIGASHLRLTCPLVVMVEDYGDEFIASWPEVEAWSSGATEAEAINGLKDEIVVLHDDLASTRTTDLGPLPRRWKAALAAVLRKRRSKR